jgi:hypothetical protein
MISPVLSIPPIQDGKTTILRNGNYEIPVLCNCLICTCRLIERNPMLLNGPITSSTPVVERAFSLFCDCIHGKAISPADLRFYALFLSALATEFEFVRLQKQIKMQSLLDRLNRVSVAILHGEVRDARLRAKASLEAIKSPSARPADSRGRFVIGAQQTNALRELRSALACLEEAKWSILADQSDRFGIIEELGRQCGGNPHLNRMATVVTSSGERAHVIADLEFPSSFRASKKDDQWIGYWFRSGVYIRSYRLKSSHPPQQWVLEGSSTGNDNWMELGSGTNEGWYPNEWFDGDVRMVGPWQAVRIRQGEDPYLLCITAFEVFASSETSH